MFKHFLPIAVVTICLCSCRHDTTDLTSPGSFTVEAEGPAVDHEGNLYAVSFSYKETIGKISPEGEGSIFLKMPEGSTANGIRFSSIEEMFIADYTGHNILKIDRNGKLSTFAHNPAMNQPNDLAITDQDILFASDPDWANSTGQLWRIDTDGSTTLLEADMGTTNGIEVSPDLKHLYVNESHQLNLWVYDLSPTGEISNKRLLHKFESGGLDGMRCDILGNLYVTRHGLGKVAVISPEGALLKTIRLKGSQPTNIAFGGPDGKTCYVTLADRGNIETFRADSPGRSWATRKTHALPEAGLGIMVGEVTSTTALAQVRLNSSGSFDGLEGSIEFTLSPSSQTFPHSNQVVEARAENDSIARASFRDLEPNTPYICQTKIHHQGKITPGPTAHFKTLAGSVIDAETNFVVVSGMNYAKFYGDDRIDQEQHLRENRTLLPPPYPGADAALGFPALQTILNEQPDFFIGTGDNVYYDTPDNPRAETVPELRHKWHEQFSRPRFRQLFAQVPTYWEVDDHDYRIDDGDNSGDHLPSVETARRMMFEQLPYGDQGEAEPLTYRTHRASKSLQLWFVENRIYRSNNDSPDGPEKSIWGEKQKGWLKQTLAASDATFKLLISPTPMIGPDGDTKIDSHCNINGFRHERDSFFRWLKESHLDTENFYIICGDRHWQYHSISPSGIEEFSCGALIDANSRLGVMPGDPKSTDPSGLIQQPYTQSERSGGFLLVNSVPPQKDQKAQLNFKFYDESGALLHLHSKKAR
mgnify:CR=1 FL=1